MMLFPARSGFVVTFSIRNECHSFGVEGVRTAALNTLSQADIARWLF